MSGVYTVYYTINRTVTGVGAGAYIDINAARTACINGFYGQENQISFMNGGSTRSYFVYTAFGRATANVKNLATDGSYTHSYRMLVDIDNKTMHVDILLNDGTWVTAAAERLDFYSQNFQGTEFAFVMRTYGTNVSDNKDATYSDVSIYKGDTRGTLTPQKRETCFLR
jgi:hypothetical protein